MDQCTQEEEEKKTTSKTSSLFFVFFFLGVSLSHFDTNRQAPKDTQKSFVEGGWQRLRFSYDVDN